MPNKEEWKWIVGEEVQEGTNHPLRDSIIYTKLL